MQVIPVLEMGFDSDKNKLSWNHEYKAPTPTYKDKRRQTVNEDENLRSNPRRLFSQLQRREFHFPFCYRESRPIPQLRLLINGESLVISRWRARLDSPKEIKREQLSFLQNSRKTQDSVPSMWSGVPKSFSLELKSLSVSFLKLSV